MGMFAQQVTNKGVLNALVGSLLVVIQHQPSDKLFKFRCSGDKFVLAWFVERFTVPFGLRMPDGGRIVTGPEMAV